MLHFTHGSISALLDHPRHEDHERFARAAGAAEQAAVIAGPPDAGAGAVDFKRPLAAFGPDAPCDGTGQPVEVMEPAFGKRFAHGEERLGLTPVERPGGTGALLGYGALGAFPGYVSGRRDLQHGERRGWSRRLIAAFSDVALGLARAQRRQYQGPRQALQGYRGRRLRRESCGK